MRVTLLLVGVLILNPARVVAQTFADVPTDYWAFPFIESLAASGITSGCGSGNYCPEVSVTRAQMAVFLERGIHGSDFSPPPAEGAIFLDVAPNDFAAGYIEQLSRDGVTGGCGGNNYCPGRQVTRAQMAVFLLRAKFGGGYGPPLPSGMFGDVSTSYWAAAWIEQLAAEGITSGCGGGEYCPESPVTRAQMAVFLVRAFGLPFVPAGNRAPVVSSVLETVDYGSQLSASVTASDADGDPLTFEAVANPEKGDLSFNADGTYVYTPAVFQADVDEFTYRANDGLTSSEIATVTIDIIRSIEISRKYDLREAKNAHWLSTFNANTDRTVIDQMSMLDLDGDDDDDLLVAQFLNPTGDVNLYQELPMVIFRNTGSGFVMEPTTTSVNMRDSAVDDFNGDGLEDVFIANQGFDDEPFPGGQSRLLLQNNDGTLTDWTDSNLPSALLFTHSTCSGDFDSDGDADLFLAIVNMEHLVYGNDGSGVFTDVTDDVLPDEFRSTETPEASFQWCEVSDFDLDGRDDLVLGHQSIGRPESETRDAEGNVLLDSNVVLYGGSSGSLVTDYDKGLLPTTWDTTDDQPQVVDMRAVDIDLDNCPDLIVSTANGGSVASASNFAVHFGDCDGGFAAPVNYTIRPTPDSANDLVIADIDGDGFVDFANRYSFDSFADGPPEVPPVSEADYHPLAYINNRSLAQPFVSRALTRWDVEQLDILAFLGLIHGSLE